MAMVTSEILKVTALQQWDTQNQDYQKYSLEANQLTTSMINEWGVSGDLAPEKGQEIVNNNKAKVDALIANGESYLKAIDVAAPKAKLDTLPKAYSDYVVAIKENIKISWSMLKEVLTII